MHRIFAGFLLCALSVSASAAADEDALAQARRLWLGGKYGEAEEIYAPLVEDNATAALGLARTLEAQGKTDKAIETLRAAAGEHAYLHAELARLAFERGDYPQAKDRSDKTLQLDRNQLLGRYIRAELHRVAGRLDDAEDLYAELIEHYNAREIKQAESLRWIGLAAARYAAWTRTSGQFQTLVGDLYPAALKLEGDYWPARYDAGRLFLQKYNWADAAKELQAALELNPNAAEVYVAMAELAVAQRDVEKAAASVDRAIEINPRLLAAWQAKADLAWANFRPQETLQLLQKKALPLNPVSEETLGRMAACYLLLDGEDEPGQPSRFSRLVDEVARRNPHAGEFYFTLAVALEERSKHAEAIRFFRKAVETMPRLLGPRSHLAMLQMRVGREDEARTLLEKAFNTDPFNVRVFNTLNVLEVLDTMKTLETDHVVLKVDGRHDALLGRYAARHLDAIYPELCRQFGFRPPRKPLLEVFHEAEGHHGQEWFSTRLIGLPYLGNAAASTGWLVAMVSPNEPGVRQFNWARVLRHELVHVITLQQTNFNIPHWYTEGLAVYCEGGSRPQLWNELLLERVPKGELFHLGTINFGFSRPQDGRDWQMAYCQAELYVEFMLSRFGSGSPRRLLAAYADGLTTDKAIRRVCGVSPAQFEREYVGYLKKLVADMPTLKHPSQADLEELLRSHRQRPDDADATAELAYAYLRRKANREARQTAEAALTLHPKHQLATYVLARLRLDEGKTPEAIELLEGCLDRDSPQPGALNLLAGLKLKAEQYDEAARLYALGERLDAVKAKWTKALARVYLLAENREKLAEVLGRLAGADPDDLAVRKKLAQMALQRRDYAAAANWANQAIQIDVNDIDMHRVFAEALVNRHNYALATEEFEVAVELKPDDPFLRFALADAYVQAKQPAKARTVLEKLLRMVPDYPGAQLMLNNLEGTEQ